MPMGGCCAAGDGACRRGGLTGVLGQARWLVLGMMLASGVTIALVWPHMRHELSPLEDRGTVLVSVNAPSGATIDYTNRYAETLEAIGRDYPEFDRVFANVGNPTVSQGSVILRTVDWEERRNAARWSWRGWCSPRAAQVPGECLCQHAAIAGPGLSLWPLNFVIQTSDSYEHLSQAAEQMRAAMLQNPASSPRMWICA